MHLQLLARAHALWRNHLVERLVGRVGDCGDRRSRVVLWPIKELSDCTLHISVVLLKEPKEVSLLGFGANNGAERRKLLDQAALRRHPLAGAPPRSPSQPAPAPAPQSFANTMAFGC